LRPRTSPRARDARDAAFALPREADPIAWADGVAPDPAKKLTLHRKDIEAIVAESWPTNNYPVLAHSGLSYADRNSALVQITFFGRFFQKCEPPFKMLEIESQASSNGDLNEIWSAQMCGGLKWNVAMTDGQLGVTLAE
jgi:hypothetical protein